MRPKFAGHGPTLRGSAANFAAHGVAAVARGEHIAAWAADAPADIDRGWRESSVIEGGRALLVLTPADPALAAADPSQLGSMLNNLAAGHPLLAGIANVDDGPVPTRPAG